MRLDEFKPSPGLGLDSSRWCVSVNETGGCGWLYAVYTEAGGGRLVLIVEGLAMRAARCSEGLTLRFRPDENAHANFRVDGVRHLDVVLAEASLLIELLESGRLLLQGDTSLAYPP